MTFYGACGVESCTDCLPLFDAANREIPGTSDPETATAWAEGVELSAVTR